MKRLALPIVLALGIAACGGDSNSNTPSVSQVTVTVRQGGGPAVGVPVQVSTGSATAGDIGTILDAANTDTAGKATFSVPASTTTGKLCFSSSILVFPATSTRMACASLNALTATVLLDHDAP